MENHTRVCQIPCQSAVDAVDVKARRADVGAGCRVALGRINAIAIMHSSQTATWLLHTSRPAIPLCCWAAGTTAQEVTFGCAGASQG